MRYGWSALSYGDLRSVQLRCVLGTKGCPKIRTSCFGGGGGPHNTYHSALGSIHWGPPIYGNYHKASTRRAQDALMSSLTLYDAKLESSKAKANELVAARDKQMTHRRHKHKRAP